MNELLTLKDIADLWKVTPEYARRYLTKLPSFPEPAPGSTRKNPRWREEDVSHYISGETASA
jgi:hypothetical protein